MSSTETKTESNRRNAKKSTGPKTAEGKQQVSTNAASHGLNSPPPIELVRKWYKVIMEDPEVEPGERYFLEYQDTALRFATAQAQVERCRNAEQAAVEACLKYYRDRLILPFQNAEVTRDSSPEFVNMIIEMFSYMEEFRRIKSAEEEEMLKAVRVAKRYRQEAESKRRKALYRFYGLEKKKNPETKPNYEFAVRA